jgi:hypothetical protein
MRVLSTHITGLSLPNPKTIIHMIRAILEIWPIGHIMENGHNRLWHMAIMAQLSLALCMSI